MSIEGGALIGYANPFTTILADKIFDVFASFPIFLLQRILPQAKLCGCTGFTIGS